MENGEFHTAEDTVALVSRFWGQQGTLTPEALQTTESTLRSIQDQYPTEIRLQLARQLFNHDNEQVRFFAASLFGAVATSSDAGQLKAEFIDLLALSIERNSSRLEIRKLCDAVATLFCVSSGWQRCFNEFLGRCLPSFIGCDYGARTQELAHNTSLLPLHVALVLSDALTEQTGRLNQDAAQNDPTIQAFVFNAKQMLPFVSALLNIDGLAHEIESPLSVLRKLLDHPAISNATSITFESDLDDVSKQVLALFAVPASRDMRDLASLVEVLLEKHRPSMGFWHGILAYAVDADNGAVSTISSHRQGQLEDEATVCGAQDLLLSIANHALETENLLTQASDYRWQRIFETLTSEFGREGEEDDEKHFSFRLLGFWSEFIDSATLALAGNEGSPEIAAVIQQIVVAVTIRIVPYIVEPASCSERDGLAHLRQEACEALRAVYAFFQTIPPSPLIMTSAYAQLAENARVHYLLWLLTFGQAISEDILSANARLAAFTVVAEYASKSGANDAAIATVLNLPQFGQTQIKNLTDIRQATKFIRAYSIYFQRHPEAIQFVLETIFEFLGCGDEELIKLAAQALSSICQQCRSQLVFHIGGLLGEYQKMAQPQMREAKAVLLEAFAAVAYAADEPTQSLHTTTKVIQFIETDVAVFRAMTLTGHESTAEDPRIKEGLRTLDSIRRFGLAISKGSRGVSAIDLEGQDLPAMSAAMQQQEMRLQQRLTNCISQILASPNMNSSEAALRLVCDIFLVRQQFAVPLIFDFPVSLHLEVMRLCVVKQLAADHALASFSKTLTSKQAEQSGQVMEEAFAFILQYIHEQASAAGDPDSLTNALELVTIFVTKFPAIVANHVGDFATVLGQLTDLIILPESMPKAAVCNLWMALLDDKYGLVSALSQQHLNNLVWNVCAQVAGGSLRQDLPVLTAVVGNLVVKGPNVRRIFEEAFKGLQRQGVFVAGWERFVSQMFMLRGKKPQTKNVVTEFWDSCAKGPMTEHEADESDEDIIVLD